MVYSTLAMGSTKRGESENPRVSRLKQMENRLHKFLSVDLVHSDFLDVVNSM